MGSAAAADEAGAGAEPASDGGAAFVSTGVVLDSGCGSTVVATAATVAAGCGKSGFWAPVWAPPTGVPGGSGARRSAWAAAAASGLDLVSGVLAPGSVGCSRLIGAGADPVGCTGASCTDS